VCWRGSPSASARRLGFAVAGTQPVKAVEQGAHLRGHPIAVPSWRPNSAPAERHRDGIRSRYAARLYLGKNRSGRDSPRIRAHRLTFRAASRTFAVGPGRIAIARHVRPPARDVPLASLCPLIQARRPPRVTKLGGVVIDPVLDSAAHWIMF
jgi:hypothetical protein